MWLCLRAIIEPENALDDLIEFTWNVQGASATSIGATGVLIALEFGGEGGTHRSSRPCKDDSSRNGVCCDDGEIMCMCELLDPGNVLGSGTMTGTILFSAKM